MRVPAEHAGGRVPIVQARVAAQRDLDALEKAIRPTTAAVLFEAIQGEGGIIPVTQEYADGIVEICRRHGPAVLVIRAAAVYGVDAVIAAVDKGRFGIGRHAEPLAAPAHQIADHDLIRRRIGNGQLERRLCLRQQAGVVHEFVQ